jgi:hypothetical protein
LWKDRKIKEETQVEKWKDREKYGRKLVE